MGRVANSDKIMWFDANAYLHDLQMVLKEATMQVRDLLFDYIQANLRAIPFKENKVKLAGGKVTSDAERKAALIESIRKNAVKYVKFTSNSIIATSVQTMVGDFKDTHIGIYYEYGTGINAEAPKIPIAGLGDYNKYRNGKEIVSRSKHIDYSGLGKGRWKDMGGNIRVTGSPEAGRHDAGFRKYIGADIEAYHWFSKAVEEVRKDTQRIYGSAIRRINPLDYLHVKKVFTLGKDRG